MQFFSQSETTWSVTRFNNGVTGGPDSKPWRFYGDGSFDAGSGGQGVYSALPGSDNTYECKVPAPGTDNLPPSAESFVDQFIVTFLSKENFVATQGNELYLFGSMADDVIDLMIVIDGESFSNTNGQQVGYMFTSVDRVISGNGTAQLQLRANQGDFL